MAGLARRFELEAIRESQRRPFPVVAEGGGHHIRVPDGQVLVYTVNAGIYGMRSATAMAANGTASGAMAPRASRVRRCPYCQPKGPRDAATGWR